MEQNKNSITTSLEYKEHRDFFETFYIYLKNANELIAHSYANKKYLSATFQAINLLRSYSSNYLPSNYHFKERLKKILKNINNPKSLDDMELVLEDMQKELENAEILPKKQNKNKLQYDFWSKEQDLILKQWKKAGMDILTR